MVIDRRTTMQAQQPKVEEGQGVIMCEIHTNKPCEFYCHAHTGFCCSKCVTNHVKCQIEGQFEALEDIYDKFEKQLGYTLQIIEERVSKIDDERDGQREKLAILETLKANDLQKITKFYEEMKARADELRVKTIAKYEDNFTKIVSKLEEHNSTLDVQRAELNGLKTQALKVKSESELIEAPNARHTHASLNQKAVTHILDGLRDCGKSVKIGYELENLLSKEEIFSDLGALSGQYSAIESQMELFMKQHFADLLESQGNREDRAGFLLQKLQAASAKPKKQRIVPQTATEEKKDMTEEYERVWSEMLPSSVDQSTIIAQIRYNSNEIYTFETKKSKFMPYMLFLDDDCKIPFNINNNCSGYVLNDTTLFLFGGEDASKKDRSTNMVYCGNLLTAKDGKKVAMKEITPMLNARQDFTICRGGDSSLYIISGYDSNKVREMRYLPKCEKLDLKTHKFYEIRDVNYPRSRSAAIYVAEKEFLYLFGGFNDQYTNRYLEKIERYNIKLNDWMTLKYNVLDNLEYSPTINCVAIKASPRELLILGGSRDGEYPSAYWVYDFQKSLLIRSKTKYELTDDITGVVVTHPNGTDKTVSYVFSGNIVNQAYSIKTTGGSLTDPLEFMIDEVKPELLALHGEPTTVTK